MVLVVSGACIFAPDQLAHLGGVSPVIVILCGVAAGLVALVGTSASVRCPACGLSLAWYALSKQAHHAWLSWLLNVEVCPRCGFSHSSGQGVSFAE